MSAAVALAEIGHNSASIGQMVEAEPAVVYRDETVLPGLIREIESEIEALKVDVDTRKGREAIASLAHSISRRKTPIIAAGKALTEDWRKKTATVNAIKSRVETDLDALRDKARAPLDAWEEAERVRERKVAAVIDDMRGWSRISASFTLVDFDAGLATVKAYEIDDTFGDRRDEAENVKVEAIAALRIGRANFVKAEAERAELEKLRAEQAERDRAAQEEEAKRAAAEAEQARIKAAEDRARCEAEDRARRELEAAIAEERRKAREAEEALAAEKWRQQEAEARALADAREKAAEEERRQADVAHRSQIMREAKEAIMTCGPSENMAKQIVLAICAGSIPHTSIRF